MVFHHTEEAPFWVFRCSKRIHICFPGVVQRQSKHQFARLAVELGAVSGTVPGTSLGLAERLRWGLKACEKWWDFDAFHQGNYQDLGCSFWCSWSSTRKKISGFLEFNIFKLSNIWGFDWEMMIDWLVQGLCSWFVEIISHDLEILGIPRISVINRLATWGCHRLKPCQFKVQQKNAKKNTQFT